MTAKTSNAIFAKSSHGSRNFLHFRNLQILGFRMVPSTSHEIYPRPGHSLVTAVSPLSIPILSHPEESGERRMSDIRVDRMSAHSSALCCTLSLILPTLLLINARYKMSPRTPQCESALSLSLSLSLSLTLSLCLSLSLFVSLSLSLRLF